MPGTDSGTFDYFTDAINGEEGASRTDYTPTEDDNVTVQGVAGSKGGLGYFGLSYYEENADKLKAVEIDARRRMRRRRRPRPCRAGSTRRCQPAAVHLPERRSCSQRPEGAAFVEYYLDNATVDRRSGALRAAHRRAAATAVAESDRFERHASTRQPTTCVVTSCSDTRHAPDVVASGLAKPRLEATRPRYGEKVDHGRCCSCRALVSVVTTLGIVLVAIPPTIEFFREVSPASSSPATEWSPLFANPSFGVLPLVIGTIVTTLCALPVCIPFGLGSAIYLSEYAAPRIAQGAEADARGARRASRPSCTASSPSRSSARSCRTSGRSATGRGVFNALSAGLVMGVMIIPTVASLSEDAMTRGAARAARRRVRARQHASARSRRASSFPPRSPGIVASFVLAVSRAVGETMIVLIAAGGQPNLSCNPGEGDADA